MQDAERRYCLEPADNSTPERIYERRWALMLLERVLERLREDSVRSIHFDAAPRVSDRNGSITTTGGAKTHIVGDCNNNGGCSEVSPAPLQGQPIVADPFASLAAPSTAGTRRRRICRQPLPIRLQSASSVPSRPLV
jgi:hypothetical protein